MRTKALLISAAMTLLSSGTALAAPLDLAGSAAPLGSILAGAELTSILITLGSILGAAGIVGGAAAGSLHMKKKRRLQLQEEQDKASTIKALDELDSAIYGGKRQSFDKLKSGLASIRERDPSFNADEFCKMAERLFFSLQTARNSGNLKELAPYVSDGFLKDLSVQLSIDDVHQRRIITKNITVRQSAIVGVELGDDFDALHVGIIARLKALDAGSFLAKDEAKIDEKMEKIPLTECAETWTFRRRPTPDRDRKGSFARETCPMCAAHLPKTGSTTCPSCAAILNSGTSDWVLTNIVDAKDFRIPQENPPPIDGFARLQALDPAVNRHTLEDRARLVFWSRLEALAQNQPYVFGRFCQPQALMQMSSIDECGIAIPRALGCRVQLVLIISDVDYERAWFRIRWKSLRKNPNGKGYFDVTDTQLLQLARRYGHPTIGRTGLSTSRCPSCGCEVTSADGKCGTCQKSVLDDWCFVEQITPETFQARQRAEKQNITALADRIGTIADPWDRRRAFMMMVAAIRSDGQVSDKERRLLTVCMERWELDPILLKAFLAAPKSDISSIQPSSIEESRMLFRALAAAAYADGRIDETEMQLLKMMAQHLKLAPNEDYEIIKSLGPQRTYVG